VIFVSSVVDTSPQETQNSKQETMKAAISMIKNREDYVQLVHTLTRLEHIESLEFVIQGAPAYSQEGCGF
jgi:hypothetical protein